MIFGIFLLTTFVLTMDFGDKFEKSPTHRMRIHSANCIINLSPL